MPPPRPASGQVLIGPRPPQVQVTLVLMLLTQVQVYPVKALLLPAAPNCSRWTSLRMTLRAQTLYISAPGSIS